MNLRSSPPGQPGFTLIELLVSMTILTLLLALLASMTESTQRTWTYTNSKIEEFRSAREAFETITRNLNQATLNTYWDYHYPGNASGGSPDRYIRQSELRFISGNAATLTEAANTPTHAIFFQAPLGSVTNYDYAKLPSLLNTCGYFIEFSDDTPSRPGFFANMLHPIHPRYRFRLMELVEPSDALSIYTFTSGTSSSGARKNLTYNDTTWFTTSLQASPKPVRLLAENIVALILLPKLSPIEQSAGNFTDASLAPAYRYDSTGKEMPTLSNANLNPVHQLPPVIQVTMVAVDEASFARMQTGDTMPDFTSGLFTNASQYNDDMETLQQTLRARKLNYRVFTTSVGIPASRWTRNQVN